MNTPVYIGDETYWNGRYAAGHGSGAGSTIPAVERKVAFLRRVIESTEIESITELGCGDFNFGKHLLEAFPHATYDGFDISEVIVGRNQAEHGTWRCNFYKAGHQEVMSADLLLCVDVLFHISDDAAYAAMLELLRSRWSKYLVVTAYEYDGLRQRQMHIRKFDPSCFGIPILREVCEQDGEMHIYIFKR